MSAIKDVSIIVKWNGREYPVTDLSDQETVAVLKHEIARLTNVRPERQKLLNLRYKGMPCLINQSNVFQAKNVDFIVVTGKAAPDDLKLSALELKPNFKLMMVGSLEADIEGVANVQYDNRDIIDDFDDDTVDDRTASHFHKMDVSVKLTEKISTFCLVRCKSQSKFIFYFLFFSCKFI